METVALLVATAAGVGIISVIPHVIGLFLAWAFNVELEE